MTINRRVSHIKIFLIELNSSLAAKISEFLKYNANRGEIKALTPANIKDIEDKNLKVAEKSLLKLADKNTPERIIGSHEIRRLHSNSGRFLTDFI